MIPPLPGPSVPAFGFARRRLRPPADDPPGKEEEHDRFILEAETDGDLTMERLSMEAKGDLFRQIYGKPMVLRQVEKIE